MSNDVIWLIRSSHLHRVGAGRVFRGGEDSTLTVTNSNSLLHLLTAGRSELSARVLGGEGHWPTGAPSWQPTIPTVHCSLSFHLCLSRRHCVIDRASVPKQLDPGPALYTGRVGEWMSCHLHALHHFDRPIMNLELRGWGSPDGYYAWGEMEVMGRGWGRMGREGEAACWLKARSLRLIDS